MKANHAKYGVVEIKDISPATVTVLTVTGETKSLIKGFANLTDNNGNSIDLDSIKIENEAKEWTLPKDYSSSRPAMPKKMKTADILAALNDNKQFDLKTKTWK